MYEVGIVRVHYLFGIRQEGALQKRYTHEIAHHPTANGKKHVSRASVSSDLILS